MICLEDPRLGERGKTAPLSKASRADPFGFFAQISVLLNKIWDWILISQEALSKIFCREISSAVLWELRKYRCNLQSCTERLGLL